MKTRIFALLLAVICLFALASCKKDTPASLYEKTSKAMEKANGMEADATIKVTMSMGTEFSESETMKMKLKANGNNMAIETDEQKIYYVDGIMYMDAGDEKYKAEISLEDFNKNYGSMSVNLEDLPQLTEEKLKDIVLVEEGDLRSFTVKVSAAEMQELLGETVKDLMGDGDSSTMTDVTMKMTFDKKDNLVGLALDFEISMETDAFSMEMAFEMEFEIINPGTAPTVTAPDDASEYELKNELFQ